MPRLLENLRLQRIVTHDVFQHSPQSGPRPPRYSSSLSSLQSNGLTALQLRITEAVARRSYCVEVEVENESNDSTFQRCADMMFASDSDFLTLSKNVADNLNISQTHPSIPDSVLLIADGIVGAGKSQKKVIILIKAEMLNGFSNLDPTGNRSLAFLENLFLTPGQQFYKVGMFIEDTSTTATGLRSGTDFTALVYDHNLSRGGELAHYYYETFMGCEIAGTAKKITQNFYFAVQKFTSEADISETVKVDIMDSIHAYLKSQTNLISARQFATTYLPESLRVEFTVAMDEAEIPDGSFAKDLTLIDSKLKRREIRFDNGVVISMPSNDEEERIDFKSGDDGQTLVSINGLIKRQR